jgi:hypothetical protein
LGDVTIADGQVLVEHKPGDGRHEYYFEIYSAEGTVGWTLERSGGFAGLTGSGLVSLAGVVGDMRGGTLYLRNEAASWRPVSFAEQGQAIDVAAGSGRWVVVGKRYDEALQQFLVVVWRSVDGEDWEALYLDSFGFRGMGQVLHAGVWFFAMGPPRFVGGAGTVVIQSEDGAVWQKSPLSGQYELYSVAHGKGMYVAAARTIADGVRVLLRSADGVIWQVTKRFDGVVSWSADVEYGGGLFAVTWRGWSGQGSPEQASYLSLDGLDWRRHSPLAGAITALDYADGRLVAAGPGGLVLRSQPLVYLGEPRLAANGSITVWFEGEGGREYTVEGTADLLEWTAVGTVRPSLSEQEVTLPIEAAGHRFYRLRVVE